MARPLRIEEPGLWHHVMNRGASRRETFLCDEDREGFLELVGECRRRWDVETHALVLMTNHYHLLVHDIGARLSRAMRHLNGVYTQRFNVRHGRDGALFRGRYRSRVVQEERYLAEIVRYIHTNPIRAGMVDRAGDYEWSSHRHLLSNRRPEWLSSGVVVELFGDDGPETRGALDEFVHDAVADDLRRSLSASGSPVFLGDERFVEAWRDKLRSPSRPIRPEVPDERRLVGRTCDEVVAATANHFGVEAETIRQGKRGVENVPRQIAMLICIDHTAATGPKIGEVFGISPSTVSVLGSAYRKRLKENPALASHLHDVRRGLQF